MEKGFIDMSGEGRVFTWPRPKWYGIRKTIVVHETQDKFCGNDRSFSVWISLLMCPLVRFILDALIGLHLQLGRRPVLLEQNHKKSACIVVH